MDEMLRKINQMIIDATFNMTAAQERTFWEELEDGTARRCD